MTAASFEMPPVAPVSFTDEQPPVSEASEGTNDPLASDRDPQLIAEHALAKVGLTALLGGNATRALGISAPADGQASNRGPRGYSQLDDGRRADGRAVTLRGSTDKWAVLAGPQSSNRSRIRDALNAFLQPNEIPRGQRSAVSQQVVGDPGDSDAGVPDQPAYLRQAQAVRQLRSNPGQLIEQLTEATRGMGDVDPQAAGALQATTVAALDFLVTKSPSPAARASGAPPVSLSDTEAARWGRYVRAVEQPLTVFDSLATGRISPEAVESLKAVYPRLYGEMQQQLLQGIVTHVAEGRALLTYPQRHALSVFLGNPIDAQTAPAFGQASQHVYAAAPIPQSKAGMLSIRPGRGGRGLMTMQTPNQRIENQ